METFNAAKKIEPSHQAFEAEKLASIIANSKTSEELIRDAELLVTASRHVRRLSIFHKTQEIYRIYQDENGLLLKPVIDDRFKPVATLLSEISDSYFGDIPEQAWNREQMWIAEINNNVIYLASDLKEGRYNFEHIDDTYALYADGDQIAVVCETADNFQFYCSETSPLVVRLITDIFVEKLDFFSQEYANQLVESLLDYQ
jgi:hypothetical protein